ncbi:MAG: glycosyltransferase family 4 protein [Terracidiphilus sp.]
MTTTSPLPITMSLPTAPSRLRIAYLLSRYPAVSHSFFLNEILQLRNLGFDIEVASINPPDREEKALARVELSESRKAYYIKSASYAKSFGIILKILLLRPGVFFRGLIFAMRLGGWNLRAKLFSLFYFAEALLLGDWMARRGRTHLHVHFSTAVATVGLLTSVAWEISYSLSVHGPDEFYDVREFSLAQKVAHAKFVFCISDFCRSQLMHVSSPQHWEKFEVIRLGVDPVLFAPSSEVEKKADGFIEVVCVGRLVSAKGQFVLVRAIVDLLEQGYMLRLKFVGDGEDRQQLESYVDDRALSAVVEFKGALNHEETRRILESADLFVLASFAEGLPVALMEAMAMEIPCISTYIAGIPELIRDGIDGLLVPASSQEELVCAMKLLIDNPQLRRKLGVAGRKRVLARHDLATNTLALAAALERNLAHSI